MKGIWHSKDTLQREDQTSFVEVDEAGWAEGITTGRVKRGASLSRISEYFSVKTGSSGNARAESGRLLQSLFSFPNFRSSQFISLQNFKKLQSKQNVTTLERPFSFKSGAFKFLVRKKRPVKSPEKEKESVLDSKNGQNAFEKGEVEQQRVETRREKEEAKREDAKESESGPEAEDDGRETRPRRPGADRDEELSPDDILQRLGDLVDESEKEIEKSEAERPEIETVAEDTGSERETDGTTEMGAGEGQQEEEGRRPFAEETPGESQIGRNGPDKVDSEEIPEKEEPVGLDNIRREQESAEGLESSSDPEESTGESPPPQPAPSDVPRRETPTREKQETNTQGQTPNAPAPKAKYKLKRVLRDEDIFQTPLRGMRRK